MYSSGTRPFRFIDVMADRSSSRNSEVYRQLNATKLRHSASQCKCMRTQAYFKASQEFLRQKRDILHWPS